MSIMFCNLCERKVESKRQFGAGSILLVIFTGGLALILFAFYKPRCPICKGSELVNAPGVEVRKSLALPLLIIMFALFIVGLGLTKH